jgi:DNA-directed RNA polymerase specialized sigma24 family protein
MKYLSELGISSNSALQKLEEEERDAVIRKMKAMQDVSIRQLARITGISKSVIDRI